MNRQSFLRKGHLWCDCASLSTSHASKPKHDEDYIVPIIHVQDNGRFDSIEVVELHVQG